MKTIRMRYGKKKVKIAVVDRGACNVLSELKLSIIIEGDFSKAHNGNNKGLLTTDAMRNGLDRLAGKHGIPSMEGYVQRAIGYFLKKYKQIDRIVIRASQPVWERMSLEKGAHPHAFELLSRRFTCKATSRRDGAKSMCSGFKRVTILKSDGSAFTGFLKNEDTLLPETDRRIFATSVNAKWTCNDTPADTEDTRLAAINAIRQAFAEHDESQSVQHTMSFAAAAVFTACPSIATLQIEMPNLHYIPVNLKALGMKKHKEVYRPTKEPSGNIKANYSRD